MPDGWQAKTKEVGVTQRAGKRTSEDLLRLLFRYLTEGKSFAGTMVIARLGGDCTLTKIAVYKDTEQRQMASGALLTPVLGKRLIG